MNLITQLQKPTTLKATDRWAEKHFDEIINFLWANRKRLLAEIEKSEFHDSIFDEPDYCGLPKKLSNKLSTDFVDAIQQAIYTLVEDPKLKKDSFARICAQYIYAE